jgi:hypothetical protein
VRNINPNDAQVFQEVSPLPGVTVKIMYAFLFSERPFSSLIWSPKQKHMRIINYAAFHYAVFSPVSY